MSIEPTSLPQFYRAPTTPAARSAADAEWQRTLPERLRTICREEMMEVMKSLVESGHITPALEAKLAVVEETARTMQEEVRRMADFSRRAVGRAVLVSGVVFGAVALLGLAGLHFLGGFSLVSAATLKDQQAQAQTKARLGGEIQKLQEEKTRVAGEVAEMAARQQTLGAEMAQGVARQQALAASLGGLEEQLGRLQQLQEQFRFKLIKGEQGGAFVEVAPEAKPFDYDGKQYIEVR